MLKSSSKASTMPEATNPTELKHIRKSVEESIILGIINLADTIRKKGDVICHRYNITTQQWILMLHLANDPNIPYFEGSRMKKQMVAAELADALNVSRPNITNLINSLIEKNLVRQIENKRDRRQKYLALTEDGWKIIDGIEPIRRKSNRKLLADLTADDKQNFFGFLKYCIEKFALAPKS
jgi:DNA-binding MarR family transcriptional regulator